MRRFNLYLLLIVSFGLFLRLYQLGRVPAGFTPDEASQAYSAYSLLKTGRDEWGTSWPISSFKSFLDYKAPLQTYLMIPSIALFGLNEFSARLPSAVFGTLAIIAIYFLANSLFADTKKNTKINIGHLAAFTLAISPWHLQFSRTALEVNLTSFLFPLGLYYFLKGVKNQKYFYFVALLWGLSLYSYHAIKVFLPPFILGIIYLYRSEIKITKTVLPAILFLIIAIPQVIGSLFGNSSSRGSDLLVSNLSISQQEEIYKSIAYSSYRTNDFRFERMLHNKYIFVLDKLTENYISYFSPAFWFTEGGRETTYSIIPGRGLLYLWMLPLIIFAVYNLIKNKNKSLFLLLLWFFLAAIPASITKEGYRPNRAGSYALLYEILVAYAIWHIFFITNKFKSLFLPTLLIIFVSFVIYQEDYYSSSATKYPEAMSYGWREAINHLKKISKSYKLVQVERGSQNQSFFAFYIPISPKVFQQEAKLWDTSKTKYLDQMGKYNIGKYLFQNFSWPENKNKDTLYVATNFATLPPDRHTVYVVDSVVGKPIIELFDFRDEQ